MKSLEWVNFSPLPASALGQVASPAPSPGGLRCLLTDLPAPAQVPPVKRSPHRQFQYGLQNTGSVMSLRCKWNNVRQQQTRPFLWLLIFGGRGGRVKLESVGGPAGPRPCCPFLAPCSLRSRKRHTPSTLGSLSTQSPLPHLHSSTPPHTHVCTSAPPDRSWLRCYLGNYQQVAWSTLYIFQYWAEAVRMKITEKSHNTELCYQSPVTFLVSQIPFFPPTFISPRQSQLCL